MKTRKYHQKGEMLFTAISVVLLVVGLIVIPIATVDELSEQSEMNNTSEIHITQVTKNEQ